MAPAETLLPILVDEIRRLKQIHALAGVEEIPVKDKVVREELAEIKRSLAQIQGLFAGKPGKPESSGQTPQAARMVPKKENSRPRKSMAAAQQEPPPPVRPVRPLPRATWL